MNDRITLKHHLIALGFVSAWCLLLAVTYATAYYEGAAGSGREVDWFNEFEPYLISNGSWILLAPIMLLLCHWFRFDRGRRMLVSIIHLIAGLLLPAPAQADSRFMRPVAAGFDLVILRPLGLVAAAAGVALFVPVAVVSAPNGRDGIQEAWELLVTIPAENVFQRPLGDF